MNQNSFFCPQCQQMRLFQQQTMNHTPHILAAIFLCGLWLPIWALIAMTHNPPWRCAFCGYTDRTEYLYNPQLKQIHAQQAFESARIREQTRIDRAGSSVQEQAAYFVSDYKLPLALGGVFAVIFGIALLSSFLSAKRVPNASPVVTSKTWSPTDERKEIARRLADDFRNSYKDVAIYGDGHFADTLVISSTSIDDRVVKEFVGSSNTPYLKTLKNAGFAWIVFKNLKKEWRVDLLKVDLGK